MRDSCAGLGYGLYALVIPIALQRALQSSARAAGRNAAARSKKFHRCGWQPGESGGDKRRSLLQKDTPSPAASGPLRRVKAATPAGPLRRLLRRMWAAAAARARRAGIGIVHLSRVCLTREHAGC